MTSVSLALLLTAAASYAAAQALVLTSATHGQFSMDAPGAVQKVHVEPTPRIGGIGIFLALVAASAWVGEHESRELLQGLLVAGTPALAVGLFEDVTKNAGVRLRLAVTIAAGAAACVGMDVTVARVDWEPLDIVLAWGPAALVFTAVAIGGLSNAINMIDGFHGLASGTAAVGLVAISAIAGSVGDFALATTALLVAAAIAGFWLVNFPWGKLFLGDGGAYFSGFTLALLAVLLPARNADVSPWASLAICSYPVIEALYSIWRRVKGRRSAGRADCEHLHSLVAARIVNPRLAHWHPCMRNSAVSVLMWSFAILPACAALVLFRDGLLLKLTTLAVLVLYHGIYRLLARREQ